MRMGVYGTRVTRSSKLTVDHIRDITKWEETTGTGLKVSKKVLRVKRLHNENGT